MLNKEIAFIKMPMCMSIPLCQIIRSHPYKTDTDTSHTNTHARTQQTCTYINYTDAPQKDLF